MPKILVVDDELLIRQWLVMCLAGPEIEVHEAENGENALLLINNDAYDMVFTDISMPKMDGMELIRAIREKDAETVIVILTCHDDFAFARTAIKYNVTEYLLKSELSKEDILCIVESQLHDRLAYRRKKKLQEEFLRGLLHSQQPQAITAEDLSHCHVPLEDRRFFALAFQTRHFDEHKLKNIHNEQMNSIVVFHSGMHVHILLANLSDRPEEDAQTIGHIQRLVSRSSENIAFYGESGACAGLTHLPEAMREAVFRWEQQFFGDAAQSLRAGEEQIRSAKNRIQEQKTDILSQYLYNGKDLTKRKILEIGPLLKACHVLDSAFLTRTVSDIFEGVSNRTQSDTLNTKAYICALQSASCLEDIQNTVHLFFEQLPEIDTTSPCIKEAKEFIALHYGESLSLSALAAKACLCEEYFSRLFKKEVGKNVSEYIGDLRMDRAKKLLLSSDFSIAEISEMVGFQNSSYFSSCFKHFYGVSPKSMRENLLSASR